MKIRKIMKHLCPVMRETTEKMIASWIDFLPPAIIQIFLAAAAAGEVEEGYSGLLFRIMFLIYNFLFLPTVCWSIALCRFRNWFTAGKYIFLSILPLIPILIPHCCHGKIFLCGWLLNSVYFAVAVGIFIHSKCPMPVCFTFALCFLCQIFWQW